MIIEYSRPEKVRRYKKQVDFINASARYTIVEATTKAGKTTGCIVWLFEQAISPYGNMYVDELGELKSFSSDEKLDFKEGFNYWWVAPIYKQARMAFRRMKRYIKPKEIFIANESELTITLANGAKIWFVSGQNPDSLYGDDVYAVVIDEATRMKEAAWHAIRSTLTATKGPVKIIGNVKGINNWVYKLARLAEKGRKNWQYYKLTAADAVEAGVLDQEEIDDAKDTLPKGVFLELYYAIPFVNSANKFAFSFERDKHVDSCSVDYNYPIWLSFDFNKNPISCAVIQYIDGEVRVCHILKLENSNIYRLCDKIKVMFNKPDEPPPYFIVNGDATGKSGSALVPDNRNYFKVIKRLLRLPKKQMQQLLVNPKISENQVLVNAVLEHVPHKIDPDHASALIFDLEFAEMLPDGTLKKVDRNDPTQQLDALDCYRYWVNKNLKHYLKAYLEVERPYEEDGDDQYSGDDDAEEDM